MTWFGNLRYKFGLKRESKALSRDISTGYALTNKDTLAAIGDLSRVVKNNPDAVDIYLALGNLYRSRGDIERALHIRQNIIARPNLDEKFKSRAWFELGVDFKRAGLLDRSLSALENARLLIGDKQAILHTMAAIFAETQEYTRASELYARLGETVPQAHYLVRSAQNTDQKGKDSDNKALERALKIYPPSPEAWLEKACRDINSRNYKRLASNLEQGLAKVKGSLRFVLLQGVITHVQNLDKDSRFRVCEKVADILDSILPHNEEDPLVHFYQGLWFIQAQMRERALQSLERSLVLSPDLWPARLELLSLTTEKQKFSNTFCTQLDFFLEKAKLVKRFVCTSCGLKREHIFFICPRCHNWHSIAFRTKLND